jgi:hypothetical protein
MVDNYVSFSYVQTPAYCFQADPSTSEKGNVKLTPVVMNGMAATLGVKAVHLNAEPFKSSDSSVSWTAFHRARFMKLTAAIAAVIEYQ